jgi:hypothetical protein
MTSNNNNIGNLSELYSSDDGTAAFTIEGQTPSSTLPSGGSYNKNGSGVISNSNSPVSTSGSASTENTNDEKRSGVKGILLGQGGYGSAKRKKISETPQSKKTVVPIVSTMRKPMETSAKAPSGSAALVKPSSVALPDDEDSDNDFFENDDDEDVTSLSLLMQSDEGVQQFTISDAMYLILRNDLTVEESKTAVRLLAKVNPRVWGDLTRCFARRDASMTGALSQGIDSMPPHNYLTLENRLVTGSGFKIVDYPQFLKLFIAIVPKLDYKSDSYYYNGEIIATLSDRAYVFKYINVEIIAAVFKIFLANDYITQMEKFYVMMIFCSNGVFKLHNGVVVYEMYTFAADEIASTTKFRIPQKLCSLRHKALQVWMEKELKKNPVSELSYSRFDFVTSWGHLAEWSKTVRTLMKGQVKPSSRHDTDKKHLNDNLSAFSGFNKNFRAMINQNKDFFVQTPEFDYYEKYFNYLPRRARNAITRKGVVTGNVADDPDGFYDWTGKAINKSFELEIKDFDKIMIMFTNDFVWLKMFNRLGKMISIEYEQRHSLNLILRPDKNTSCSSKALGKRWFAHAKSIYEAEVLYMTNMMCGEFFYTNATNNSFDAVESVTIHEDEFFGSDSEDEDSEY